MNSTQLDGVKQPLEKQLFIVLMSVLQEQHNRQLSDLLLNMFYDQLKGLTNQEFQAAIYSGINEKFWPTPARLIELAKADVTMPQNQTYKEPVEYQDCDPKNMSPEALEARRQAIARVKEQLKSVMKPASKTKPAKQLPPSTTGLVSLENVFQQSVTVDAIASDEEIDF